MPVTQRGAAAGESALTGGVRQGADYSHLSMMWQQLSRVATFHHESIAVACEELRDGSWTAKGHFNLSQLNTAKQQLIDIASQAWNTGLGALRTFEAANKGTQNYSLDKSAISPNGLQC